MGKLEFQLEAQGGRRGRWVGLHFGEGVILLNCNWNRCGDDEADSFK